MSNLGEPDLSKQRLLMALSEAMRRTHVARRQSIMAASATAAIDPVREGVLYLSEFQRLLEKEPEIPPVQIGLVLALLHAYGQMALGLRVEAPHELAPWIEAGLLALDNPEAIVAGMMESVEDRLHRAITGPVAALPRPPTTERMPVLPTARRPQLRGAAPRRQLALAILPGVVLLVLGVYWGQRLYASRGRVLDTAALQAVAPVTGARLLPGGILVLDLADGGFGGLSHPAQEKLAATLLDRVAEPGIKQMLIVSGQERYLVLRAGPTVQVARTSAGLPPE